MVELTVPDLARLREVNEAELDDFPRFARARRRRDPPRVDDVSAATREALEAVPALEGLPRGAEVAVTAGSRGVHDMPAVVEAVVTDLRERGLDPFVMPAMGSHGGATAEGQVETLASLGITEESVDCEIRSSMEVERVADDDEGRPVFAAVDALEADAVVLVNRVKLHTDYSGPVESGLCKMAVVGLGKHRGAEAMHNTALARGFDTVVPERAEILFAETPVVGGVAIVENAEERAAEIAGVPVDEILDREPALLERSEELFPRLPVDQLDLLVVDEMGKEISGTGLDTNVIGRVWFHNQAELDSPEITRIYVRSLTAASHGNGLGCGLADLVHEDLVADLDLEDTYVNIATSGEAGRARIPVIVPADEAAFLLAYSMTGARDPGEMRIARIRNTLEPDDLLVSEPVAEQLRDRPDVDVGELRPLAFEAGELAEEL
jgi:hypothetical protein